MTPPAPPPHLRAAGLDVWTRMWTSPAAERWTPDDIPDIVAYAAGHDQLVEINARRADIDHSNYLAAKLPVDEQLTALAIRLGLLPVTTHSSYCGRSARYHHCYQH